MTNIGREAFYGCSSLISITLPKNLNYIEGLAFSGCEKLSSIYCKSEVPPISEWWKITDDYWKDPFYSYDGDKFSSCIIYVPLGYVDTYKEENLWSRFDNIVGVNDNIRFNITSETENTVEVSRQTTGEYAGDIIIPEQIIYNDKTYTVTGIADDAFSGCPGITSVTIGGKETTNESNVTNNPVAVMTRATGSSGIIVGERAFKGCSGLRTLTLGENVTSIDEEAFTGCISLTDVTCESIYPPAALANIFNETTYNNATLTVPETFLSIYQTTTPWSLFTNVMTGINNITQEKANKPRKIFQNSKLIIRKNGKTYNLQGAEIM